MNDIPSSTYQIVELLPGQAMIVNKETGGIFGWLELKEDGYWMGWARMGAGTMFSFHQTCAEVASELWVSRQEYIDFYNSHPQALALMRELSGPHGSNRNATDA